MTDRLSTGIPDLDEILGGGLIHGKTAVVYGATGVGKTVLGTTIAYAGIQGEGHPGIILDINQGVDEQGHIKYARSMLGWDLQDWGNVNAETPPEELVKFSYYASVRYTVASNVLRGIMSPSLETVSRDEDLVRHHFPKTLRVIVDGSEPYRRAVNAQVLNDLRHFYKLLKGQNEVEIRRSSNGRTPTPLDTQPYWDYFVTQEQIDQYIQSQTGKFKFGFLFVAATDEEKEMYRRLSKDDPDFKHTNFVTNPKYLQPQGPIPINTRVEQYDTSQHIVVFLQTTKTKDIFELARAEIEVGGLDHEVNTIIAMGYIPATREQPKTERALAVLKHRGSKYDSEIREYQITDSGIRMVQ